MTVDWIAQFSARARGELSWTPQVVDLGGGLGVRHVPEEPLFTIAEFVRGMTAELQRAFQLQAWTSRSSCSSRAARSSHARA
jgi:Diaminopimelate decarboxylase